MKRVKLSCIDHKYEVLCDGTIYNTLTRKFVKFCYDAKGYLKARLKSPFSNNPDNRKPYRLHRLIAMAFLDDYSDDLQVNHINGNKADNRIENLEMVNNSQNAKHAWDLDKINGCYRRKKLEFTNKGYFKKKERIL